MLHCHIFARSCKGAINLVRVKVVDAKVNLLVSEVLVQRTKLRSL